MFYGGLGTSFVSTLGIKHGLSEGNLDGTIVGLSPGGVGVAYIGTYDVGIVKEELGMIYGDI